MGMTALHNIFERVENHSDEGRKAASAIHEAYEDVLRGNIQSLATLRNFRYTGSDTKLDEMVRELVIQASSVGASQ
jgi:hypothetical protein